MGDTHYIVTWDIAPNPEGAVKKDDLPKGMNALGKQGDVLKRGPEMRAIYDSLRASGFEVDDVKDEQVYKVTERGKIRYWVPYTAKWQHSIPVGWKTHYALASVGVAPLTQEEVKAQLEEHKAAQMAELEAHKAEQESALEKMRAELELQKQKVAAELEIAKMRREIEAMQAGANTPAPSASVPGSGTPAGGMPGLRTYEVFGILNGQRVPLAQVAVNQGGRYVQVPGSRVMVGDNAADGFGLAGVPGAWPNLYPGQSPASYGLDPDKAVMGHDGTRGYVLPALFLSQVFGPNWRSQIYG